jgi:two-component system response regulator MprA
VDVELHPQPNTTRSGHVLVEDGPTRDLLIDLLCDQGYAILGAAHAAEAPGSIDRALPSEQLVDLLLPEIGAADELRTLRGRGDRVPVVLLSASREAGDIARGVRVGALLGKPFDLDEVSRVLGALAGGRAVPR